jgi:hypothetical protein
MRLYELFEEQEITPQQYAADILAGKNKPWKDTYPAYYDAEFGEEGDEPYFIMIASKIQGKGFGYIAFLDFLRHVQAGNKFTSSDFTKEGRSLFDRVAKAGFMKQVKASSDMTRKTEWEVLKDSTTELKRIAG